MRWPDARLLDLQRQQETQEQTGNDGKVKAEIAFAVMDVSRQAPQPGFAKTAPKQQSNRRQNQAGDK